jgi:hypothetical protein
MRPPALLADRGVYKAVVFEFREGKMQSKTLIVLIAAAIMGVSSTAMAKGGGGGWLHGVSMHGHGHFDHRFRFVNRFNRGLFNNFNGWGWGGDCGWGGGCGWYGEGSGNNTTVVISQPPVSRFPVAGVTGSIAPDPCHWNTDTFNVPSAAGGTRPVEVVSCR